MITFYFDDTKDMPMYEQLYRYLKEAIEKNELHANEKLPSKRKLATHLKISQTTIETAYWHSLFFPAWFRCSKFQNLKWDTLF